MAIAWARRRAKKEYRKEEREFKRSVGEDESHKSEVIKGRHDFRQVTLRSPRGFRPRKVIL